MAAVLVENGGGWLARDDVATLIAEYDLFRRPSDGQPPPPYQLAMRARRYPQLFEGSDSQFRLIRLRLVQPTERPRPPARASRRQTAHRQPPPRKDSPSDSLAERRDARARRERAARKFKPGDVRLLLVAEAPPGALDRYFYFTQITKQDSLFRYVTRMILGVEPTRDNKGDLLAALKDAGVFLIDLCRDPVDGSPLDSHVPQLVRRCRRLSPTRIVLIKATVYDAAYRRLAAAGLPVVDERIPFPGSGQQRRFEEAFARALGA